MKYIALIETDNDLDMKTEKDMRRYLDHQINKTEPSGVKVLAILSEKDGFTEEMAESYDLGIFKDQK